MYLYGDLSKKIMLNMIYYCLIKNIICNLRLLQFMINKNILVQDLIKAKHS